MHAAGGGAQKGRCMASPPGRAAQRAQEKAGKWSCPAHTRLPLHERRLVPQWPFSAPFDSEAPEKSWPRARRVEVRLAGPVPGQNPRAGAPPPRAGLVGAFATGAMASRSPKNFGRILGTFRVLRVLAARRTELPTGCQSPAGVRSRRSQQPVAARASSSPCRRRRLRKRDAAYLRQCLPTYGSVERRPHRGA